MPPESGEGLLDRGRFLVSPKGIVHVCPCHAVWRDGAEHLQDFICQRIAQCIPKNVGGRRVSILPQRQGSLQM
jgi:hypothetical protein